MLKRFFFIIIIMSVLAVPAVGIAAPDELAPDAQGNTTGLIEIANFEDEELSTFEKNYILSGSGQEDVVVTLYVYTDTSQKYQKVVIAEKDATVEDNTDSESGAEGNMTVVLEDMNRQDDDDSNKADDNVATRDLQWTIGPSGWFMQRVELAEGKNRLMLYAEKGEEVEIKKIDITLLKKDLLQTIKSLSIDIKDQLEKKMMPENPK